MGKVSSKQIKSIPLNQDALEIVFNCLPIKVLKLLRSVCSEWNELIRVQLWRQPALSNKFSMNPNELSALNEISTYAPPIRFLRLSQFGIMKRINCMKLVKVLLEKFELSAFELDYCNSNRDFSNSEMLELFKLPISQMRTRLFDLADGAVLEWYYLLLATFSAGSSRPGLILCNNFHAHLAMNNFRKLAASFRITQIDAEFAEDFTEFEDYNQLVSQIRPQPRFTLYGNAHYPDDSCTLLRRLNAVQITHIHTSYLIKVDWHVFISALQSKQQISIPLTLHYFYGIKTKLITAMLNSLARLGVRFRYLSTLDLELNDDNAVDFVKTLLDINACTSVASEGMIHKLAIDSRHRQYFGPQTIKQLKNTGTQHLYTCEFV